MCTFLHLHRASDCACLAILASCTLHSALWASAHSSMKPVHAPWHFAGLRFHWPATWQLYVDLQRQGIGSIPTSPTALICTIDAWLLSSKRCPFSTLWLCLTLRHTSHWHFVHSRSPMPCS
jgi:hypothetical protein